jgi:hypothetical protein
MLLLSSLYYGGIKAASGPLPFAKLSDCVCNALIQIND